MGGISILLEICTNTQLAESSHCLMLKNMYLIDLLVLKKSDIEFFFILYHLGGRPLNNILIFDSSS